MKTFLLTTLALSLAVAGPNFASAGGNKKHSSGNFNHFSGGNHNKHFNHYKPSCHSHKYYHQPYYTPVYVCPGYEPFHCYYTCQPGDTWYNIAMHEYGNSGAMQYIARYNQMSLNSALVPGQLLRMPSVARSGLMTASQAPAPQVFANQNAMIAPQQQNTLIAPQQLATPAAPSATIAVAPTEPSLPSVTVGSSLSIDGVQFGDASGSVRLKIGPMSVPVTIIEWSATSVKVQLPTVDLETATPASLDVFKADGSLVSQSAIRLSPAGSQIAKVQ